MRFKKYFSPSTIEEAYIELLKSRKNRVLGGSSYLRISDIELETVIDLSKLGLDKIEDNGNEIEIGAMVSFRELEINPLIKNYNNGILSKSVSGILGVQFRNNVTVGGTVASKYGFSDLITPLLASKAKVVMFNQGELTLEEYLSNSKVERDILISVRIPKTNSRGVFKNIRKSATDYSIINIAVVKDHLNLEYQVAIGSRPKRATLLIGKNLEELKNRIDKEIEFQSNTRGSQEYRREVAKKLLEIGIEEVEN